MRKFKLRSFVALLAVLALTAAACGGDDDEPSGDSGSTGASATGACATADTSAGDLLAKICDEGVIRVSTDPAYPPQSSLNPETNEYEGFDIDVATAIADKLGVEIEWETPKWEAITAGNWQDRWDMSVGSMTVTEERTEVLDFSPAYYYTPASVAVHEDSDIQSIDQLDGQTIGVCAGCTYDFYLQGTLDIPGYTFESPFTDITVKGYDTDSTAIQALVSGQVAGRDVGDSHAGEGHREGSADQARRGPALLRAALGRVRQGVGARPGFPGGSGLGHHRHDARRRNAHRPVDAVVRHRPDGQQRSSS